MLRYKYLNAIIPVKLVSSNRNFKNVQMQQRLRLVPSADIIRVKKINIEISKPTWHVSSRLVPMNLNPTTSSHCISDLKTLHVLPLYSCVHYNHHYNPTRLLWIVALIRLMQHKHGNTARHRTLPGRMTHLYGIHGLGFKLGFHATINSTVTDA